MTHLTSHFGRFTLKTILLTVSFALLTACGGSGGDSPAPKPNETQPKPQPQPGATDTTAPIISDLSPVANLTIGSASNKRPVITVSFSENVKNVNATNVVLKQGSTPVAVTITGSGTAYTIKPKADLVSDKPYTLEFNAGIKDVAGNALNPVSISYRTSDWVAPTISRLDPADGTTIGSASNKKPTIEVRFSENVKNVNNTNVVLKQGSTPVAVTITGSGAVYSIEPKADLVSDKPYTLEFKAGIKDVAGNALNPVSISYRTPDWVALTLTTTPADGATIGDAYVKRPTIKVRFSKDVKNVNAVNVLLKQVLTPVAVTITGSGTAYTIKPKADLVSDKSYTLEFNAGIKDVAGNALNPVSISYRTSDWVAPTISRLDPADGTTIGSASNKKPTIEVRFSENVKNVNNTNVVLKQGSTPVAVTITGSGATYSIEPKADLLSNKPYTLEFNAGIKDVAGNALNPVSISYRTPDWVGVAPAISRLDPADGTTIGSASNKKPAIKVRFSKSVKNVNNTNVVLKQGSTPVAVTITGSGTAYNIKPKVDLVSDKPYTLEFKAGIKDIAGNALKPVSISYRTPDWVAPTPTGLRLTMNGQSLKVDWNPVANASSYKVYLAEQSMNTLTSPSFANHSSLTGSRTAFVRKLGGDTYTFRSLAYGKTYYVMVQSLGNGRSISDSTYASGQEKSVTLVVPPPVITLLLPAANKTIGSAANKRPTIQVFFSKSVQNVNTNVVLKQGTTPVAITITRRNRDNYYWIKPDVNLVSGKPYTLEFKAGIKDAAGRALKPVSINYRTKDWVAPTISRLDPTDGTTIGNNAANRRPTISVRFSENVNNVKDNVALKQEGSTPVALIITGSGKDYSIKPATDLVSNKPYTLEFKAGITDITGNALNPVRKIYNTNWVAPTISRLDPADGSTIVIANNKRPTIEVSFSKSVQNVNNTNLMLKQGSTPVAVNITGSGTDYSITPQADLLPNKSYTLEFKAGIKGIAGNALTPVSKSYQTSSLNAPAPTGLRLTVSGQNLKVDWNAVTSASGYKVYLAEQSMSALATPSFANHNTLTGSQIQAVNSGTTHTFTGLDYGKTYYVVVQFIGNGSTIPNSTYASGQEENAFITVAAPTKVQFKKDGSNYKLAWNKITGINNFVVYSAKSDLSGKTVAQLEALLTNVDATKKTTKTTHTGTEKTGITATSAVYAVVVSVANGTNSAPALADSLYVKQGQRFYKMAGYTDKCVVDMDRSIIWEVKQASGLHGKDHTYSWYQTMNNRGNPGSRNEGICHNKRTTSNNGNQCDTTGFVTAVNAEGWCGFNDWRMPTGEKHLHNKDIGELKSLSDKKRKQANQPPMIDINFFPNTAKSFYWSSLTRPSRAGDASRAYGTDFRLASDYYNKKSEKHEVRLVRDR